MFKNHIKILTILFLLTTACEKQKVTNEPIIEETVNSDDDINPFDTLLIWKIEDGFKSPGHIKLYDDLIITAKEPTLGQAYSCAYSEECGQSVWDYPLNTSYIARSNCSFIVDGVVIESRSQRQWGINAKTGGELWKMNVFEDFGHYYNKSTAVNYTNGILTNEISADGVNGLYIVNPNNGSLRKMFEIKDDTTYRYYPLAPVTHILPNQDTLAYSLTRKLRRVDNSQEVDLYCYNITQKELVWEVKSFEKNNNIYPTQIDLETNSIIVLGLRCVYSFDLITGKENWRHERGWPHNMLGSNYLINKEKVIFGEDIGPVVALNKFTGELIWENDEFCCQIHDIKVYENLVLANGGWLMFLDLETGKTKYIIRDPDVSSNLFGGTAIDKKLKRLYIADYSYLYALKIPNFE